MRFSRTTIERLMKLRSDVCTSYTTDYKLQLLLTMYEKAYRAGYKAGHRKGRGYGKGIRCLTGPELMAMAGQRKRC